ncbi:hypothetical protein IHE44_0008592 [Lamprotornis superbus]|uniref:Immunoglobulin V-set domain-containing protein n=1 Tax=Lamprotornis superbus TaxID=245042 RepID=A0A835TSC5_9PASS|nr:hypothetical protein IHE44_0008592 [Lamprotornis superbus]
MVNHGVPVGRFKSRLQWQGDVSRRDGSIRLHDLRLNDSGTYECELRLLEDSSIFKSQTELLVSSEPRGACPAPAASPAALRVPAVPSSPAALVCPRQDEKQRVLCPGGLRCVGCSLLLPSSVTLPRPVSPRLPKLLGCAYAYVQRGCSVPNTLIHPSQEAIYSSIPGAEVPKAEKEAKKKRRAEDTYITMHPSHCRDNGVYVELAKRAIPTEWMAEGTQGDGQSQEPHSRPEEALPRPPERQK